MPTPFTDDDRVDMERLSALSAFTAKAGIHPAVLGGMGEFYALNRAESRDCMAAAIEGAAGVPVVAGIGWATREAVELAVDASELGVDTLVLNPPYYASPSPEAYAEHVRSVTEASGIGAITYSSRGYPMTDAHLELLVRVPGFRGVKEEHYDVAATAGRISRWGDRIDWWGVGEANGAEYARVGANTVTSSLSSMRPDLVVRAIRSLVGDRADQEAIRAVSEWIVALLRDDQGSPAFLKEIMHLTAGWSRSVRLPLLPSGAEGREAAQEFYREWGEQ